MKKQNGFTLIELVIVIIVLGILAATAVPKFINLQDDAKESAMSGVEAALNSAANIVYSKAAIDGVENATSASSAAGVTTQFGYPEANATGIVAAVELSGFTSKFTDATTGTKNISFVSENEFADGDLCLLYTQVAALNGSYTLDKGKVASSACVKGSW